MALDSTLLKEKILSLTDENDSTFIGFPTDIATAATNWASAYHTYAKSAQDVSGDFLETSNPTEFENVLAAGFSDQLTIEQAADLFEQAFTVYWVGAIFEVGLLPPNGVGGNGIFGVETTSIVDTITPNILKNLLLTEFAILSSDADTKSEALANIFHEATTTAIFVLITGTDTTPPASGGPLPIINIDVIN